MRSALEIELFPFAPQPHKVIICMTEADHRMFGFSKEGYIEASRISCRPQNTISMLMLDRVNRMREWSMPSVLESGWCRRLSGV